MSKVDDELTRRLHRAERPVDGDGVFEGLARRRSHRERVRRVQTGLLAFAVLAATAGGFLFLRDAFEPDKRNVGDEQTPSVANGEIVFSRASSDGEHLFLVEPDGTDLRQITDGDFSDRLPAWSPDGRRIVFVRQAESSIRLYVLEIDSGDARPITPPSMGGLSDPHGHRTGSSSPSQGSGMTSATSGSFGPTVRSSGGSRRERSSHRTLPGGHRTDRRSRSPRTCPTRTEGTEKAGTYISIGRDGSGLRNLTSTPNPEQSESPTGGSPDGNLLISESPGTITLDLDCRPRWVDWLEVTPSGDLVRVVLEDSVNTGKHLQEPRLSPDGRFAVFDSARGGTQEVWFLEVATLRFTQVTTSGGYGAAWQPVSVVSGPSPTPTSEPTVSPSAEPAGRDIGLAFDLCDVQQLTGIDFLGDGTMGTAWTGNKTTSEGACPGIDDDRYGVAVDFTGDGVADSWSGETIEHCTGCEPFKAADLNVDGNEELIVTRLVLLDHAVRPVHGDAGRRRAIGRPVPCRGTGTPSARARRW